jgi:N-acetylglucosaminyldiphosphoundecaprenol N-acetyl-beta-D-mannosaminyltransferase
MIESKKMHKTANILGFSLFSNHRSDLLKKIKIHLSSKNELLVIFTPNAEQLVQASVNPNFSRQLRLADVLVPDGISLVWSSRLLSIFGRSKPILQRIAGVDLVKDLLQISQEQKLKMLLIGGEDYQELIKPLQDKHDFIWTQGYQQIAQPSRQEEQSLDRLLLSSKPDIVFVAFGAPFQEEWVIKNQELLKRAKVKLVMTVGGSFDIIFGRLSRAPFWMRRIGLEWLFRLIQEPWRWKRQTRLFKFIFLVLGQLFSSKAD